MDVTNDDQNAYAFFPTYGDESTAFHRHMISVVVFFYSNIIQSMLVDYLVIEMSFFYDCSYAALNARTMRGDVVTNFPLHVSQYITLN